jgi:hypothetical protein
MFYTGTKTTGKYIISTLNFLYFKLKSKELIIHKSVWLAHHKNVVEYCTSVIYRNKGIMCYMKPAVHLDRFNTQN